MAWRKFAFAPLRKGNNRLFSTGVAPRSSVLVDWPTQWRRDEYVYCTVQAVTDPLLPQGADQGRAVITRNEICCMPSRISKKKL